VEAGGSSLRMSASSPEDSDCLDCAAAAAVGAGIIFPATIDSMTFVTVFEAFFVTGAVTGAITVALETWVGVA